MNTNQAKLQNVNRIDSIFSPSNRSLTLVFVFLLSSNAVFSQTVVYDSPAQNYITGISGLLITGTSNDGVYDVSFTEGSFNAVFGAATMTSDLDFQNSNDGSVASSFINTVLNTVTPNGPVASLTDATPGSGFTGLYMVPTDATMTYAASLSTRDLTTNWSGGAIASLRDRTSLIASGVCGTCIAKWAQFTLTGPASAPVQVPTLSVWSIIFLVLLLALATSIRLRRSEIENC